MIMRLGRDLGLTCIVRSGGGYGPVPCLASNLTGPSLLLARRLVPLVLIISEDGETAFAAIYFAVG